MITIDDDDYDYCNVPICSSLIKCTSKILYNLYTTPLAPNGPFLGSRLVKNEFKTRIFQETTMRIRNARYCGALIYRNYLDTSSNVNVGWYFFYCCDFYFFFDCCYVQPLLSNCSNLFFSYQVHE